MTIKELQELYYSGFSVLKTFCEEKGLTLYPVGGTLLGIVLFGDFIPWDDDLDLAMPRDDYEALYNMRDRLRERGLMLERYRCSRNFPYPYSKILFANCVSTRIMDEAFGFNSDLVPAFDLYPIDTVGDTIEEAAVKIHRVNKVKMIYDVKVTPVNRIKNPLKRVFASLIHLIPMKCILACYDLLMSDKAGDALVTRWRGPDYEKHIYDRSLWFETVRLSFKNISVDCPAGYDEILQDVYGEYMEPYTYQGEMRHAAEKNRVTQKYYARMKMRFLDE